MVSSIGDKTFKCPKPDCLKTIPLQRAATSTRAGCYLFKNHDDGLDMWYLVRFWLADGRCMPRLGLGTIRSLWEPIRYGHRTVPYVRIRTLTDTVPSPSRVCGGVACGRIRHQALGHLPLQEIRALEHKIMLGWEPRALRGTRLGALQPHALTAVDALPAGWHTDHMPGARVVRDATRGTRALACAAVLDAAACSHPDALVTPAHTRGSVRRPVLAAVTARLSAQLCGLVLSPAPPSWRREREAIMPGIKTKKRRAVGSGTKTGGKEATKQNPAVLTQRCHGPASTTAHSQPQALRIQPHSSATILDFNAVDVYYAEHKMERWDGSVAATGKPNTTVGLRWKPMAYNGEHQLAVAVDKVWDWNLLVSNASHCISVEQNHRFPVHTTAPGWNSPVDFWSSMKGLWALIHMCARRRRRCAL
ncbi:hypothetical protein GGX14DRAFT_392948 [Mycena pura]|uniref:Uncharacterized protein n=1 Tax=Mycena pura TaxID=153505 RepID=A0AAD6VHS9_9AGAR|nr:hypothetical protein GGX14DRAFT_392948 [Mycena pura]